MMGRLQAHELVDIQCMLVIVHFSTLIIDDSIIRCFIRKIST
jgi:hypothetical protein